MERKNGSLVQKSVQKNRGSTAQCGLEEELTYLERHDRLKEAISKIVELPSRKLELLIRCLVQNRGKLANRKRLSQFAMLTDQEIAQIEKVTSTILTI